MYTGNLEPISNRADYVETITLTDSDGNNPSVTAAKFRLCGKGVDIEKTLDSGITYDSGTGALVVTIADTDLSSVCPGTYDVGIRVTISGAETQLFAGTIAVLDGIVS